MLFLACAALGLYVGRVIRIAWQMPSSWSVAGSLLLFLFLLPGVPRGGHGDRGRRSTLAACAVFSLVLALYCYVIDAFGAFDIPAVQFHLTHGLEVEGDPKIVRYFFMYLAIWALFVWAIRRLRAYDLRVRFMDRAALVVCLLANPLWLQAYEYLDTDAVAQSHLATLYRPASLQAAPSGQPKNLVIVYLESLERTLADPVFDGIYDDVVEVEKGALSFTGLEQVEAVGWTTAGMVGSQCGVPLMPYGILGGNNLDRADAFLPGAECLGSDLRAKGYRTTYIGGADLEFAGKGNFYREHGFQRVLGREELLSSHSADVNEWGVPDDAVFAATLKEWQRLDAQAEPFALAMLTTGAHAPDGFPTPACQSMWPGKYEESMSLGVKCSAWLAREMLAKARRLGLLENTTVVILSDHLMHKSPLSGQLDDLPRRLLFLVLDSDLAPRKVARAGSILDVYPTVLDALGMIDDHQPRAGLGVSLLSNHKTLVESMGLEKVDELIRKDRWLRARLWGYEYAPRLGAGKGGTKSTAKPCCRRTARPDPLPGSSPRFRR